jgi:RNA polymerase sigma-70 factor (ECF subfamily)
MRYINNTADAEEVLSNGFLKCFKSIEQFTWQGDGSIQAWLSRIVVNECLMFLRKRKSLYIPIEDNSVPEQAVEQDNILEHIHARELLKHLHGLPDGYRTVLNLYVFEDMSHKEIAETLQISENTSKSQLHKARAMLKQKLQAHLV